MTFNRSILKTLTSQVALLIAALLAQPSHSHALEPAPAETPGILLVTPDRGFLGNAEVQDAFDVFAQGRNAELLYVTDARSEVVLDQRLAALRSRGARTVVVLPLVVSEQEARWQQVREWLQVRAAQGTQLIYARHYGASYLSVEDLADRLRAAHANAPRLLLIGYGAGDLSAAATMRDELRRMAGFATTLPGQMIDAIVYPESGTTDAQSLRTRFSTVLRDAHGALVVPVGFAPRAEAMMDFSSWFRSDLPEDAQLLNSPIASGKALTQWMHRATAQSLTLTTGVAADQVGVVALTHGADWFWNQAIKEALAPTAANHKLAFAFSMADPPVIERAVHELERDSARAIIVVRAFGMADSFRDEVIRMLGLDVESSLDGPQPSGHHMAGMDHSAMGHMEMNHLEHHGGSGAEMAAAPRIRSSLPMVTVGGVDDSPEFAQALLANALAVSRDPARETIILMAHGQGDTATNQHWLELLASLSRQMKTLGGEKFRAIRYATWQEDWPDLNRIAVAQVRAMVEEAGRDGGRALIVPARINGRGAADRYLAGLDFGWGQGFVQTPYFARWFEAEIVAGQRALRGEQVDP